MDKSKLFFLKRLDLLNLRLHGLRLLLVPGLTFGFGFILIVLSVFKTRKGKDFRSGSVLECVELAAKLEFRVIRLGNLDRLDPVVLILGLLTICVADRDKLGSHQDENARLPFVWFV